MPEKEILTPSNVAESDVAARITIGGVQAKFPHELTPGLVMGIVASPNTGKTTLLATLRDSERGVPAMIIDHNANAHVLPTCEDLLVFKNHRCFDTAKAAVEDLKAGRHPQIKSICFDHVTAMYNDTVANGGASDMRQNYQTAMKDLINLTRDCIDLAEGPRRLNVFFLFQESQEGRVVFEDGEAKGIMRQEVSLSDKMQTLWPNYVPLMGGLRIGMYVNPYPRVLDFTPSSQTMTKWQVRADDRLARLPVVMWNPNLGKMIDVLVGNDPVPPEWLERPQAKLQKG